MGRRFNDLNVCVPPNGANTFFVVVIGALFPIPRHIFCRVGLKRSGVDPPFCSSRACLHTAFTAVSVRFMSKRGAHAVLLHRLFFPELLNGVRVFPCPWQFVVLGGFVAPPKIPKQSLKPGSHTQLAPKSAFLVPKP